MKNIIRIAIGVFLGCCCCKSPNNTTPDTDTDGKKNIQVWMNPITIKNTEPVNFTTGAWDLSDLSKWTKTQKGLDVVYVFIDAICHKDVTDAQLESFCDMLKKTDTKLAIELAGLGNWYQTSYQPGTDDYAYNSMYGDFGDYTRLKKLMGILAKRGLIIEYLNFDHAFMRAMNPKYANESPKMSIREAAEQLYKYMAMWHKECAGTKFNYIVNFPNHGWKRSPSITGNPTPAFSDYYFGDFYDDFQEICRLNEISDVKMNAIVVDFPYNPYLNSDMVLSKTEKKNRIKDLEKETKAAGMEYGVIFNSEDEGMGRTSDHNRQYFNASMEFIAYYLANGGDPDYFINEAWYQYPDKLLPEDEPFTLMNLTLEIIKKYKK